MEKITKKDIDWCDKPIVGAALIMTNNEVIDSAGDPVQVERYYDVGKHKDSGMVAIVPLDKTHPGVAKVFKRFFKK